MKELKIIPIEEVPFRLPSDWENIYKKIPVGKALVLSQENYNFRTVRASLRHHHKKGRWLNLIFLQRKNFGYLINRGLGEKT